MDTDEKDQPKHWPDNAARVLEWLLNNQYLGYRMTGRSHLMADVYAGLALRYPGSTIAIRDHVPYRRADENLLYMVKRRLDQAQEAAFKRGEKMTVTIIRGENTVKVDMD